MIRMYTKRAVARRISAAGLALAAFVLGSIVWISFIPEGDISVRWKGSMVAVVAFAFMAHSILLYAGSFKSLKQACFLSEKCIVDRYITEDVYAREADLRKVKYFWIDLAPMRAVRSMIFAENGNVVRCSVIAAVVPDMTNLQAYVDTYYSSEGIGKNSIVHDALSKLLDQVALDKSILTCEECIGEELRTNLRKHGLAVTYLNWKTKSAERFMN